MCDLLHLVWHLNLVFSVFDRGDGFSLAQRINRKCFLREQLLMWDIPEFEFLVTDSGPDWNLFNFSLKKKKVKSQVFFCVSSKLEQQVNAKFWKTENGWRTGWQVRL